MLPNRSELESTLAAGDLLGAVFARHAYGMRRWVDLFSARVPGIHEPEAKELVATLVADNARHMNLFRARAAAHGVDADRYAPPAEGEAIYERLDELATVEEIAGYALGSLDHFAELLEVYAVAASADDMAAIAAVRADVDRARAALRARARGSREDRAAEAHELYRRRELVETPRYAGVG
jgi:hypothetical protein